MQFTVFCRISNILKYYAFWQTIRIWLEDNFTFLDPWLKIPEEMCQLVLIDRRNVINFIKFHKNHRKHIRFNYLKKKTLCVSFRLTIKNNLSTRANLFFKLLFYCWAFLVHLQRKTQNIFFNRKNSVLPAKTDITENF